MSPRSNKQFEEIREQSTAKIINAALELFAQEGYERTSISKIAAKAGVSKGLIYNYYSSKEHLLEVLMISMFNEFDLSMLTTNIDNGHPKEALQNIIDFTFEFIEKHPRKMMLITKLSLQVAQFDFLQDMIKEKANLYFGLTQKLFEQLDYPDPKSEAYILSFIFDGLAVQALSMKDKFWFEESKKAIYRKYTL